MTMRKLSVVMAVGVVALGAGVRAQDTRVVTEPKIPVSCVVLKAELMAGAKGLEFVDEGKLDTARVQQALDGCGEGKGVELAADGAKAAFLIGPIELRKGVTLVVDKGVMLYGSRAPKDYEVTAGSCGVVIDSGPKGCKPLISGKGVSGAGVMGDGVIDGRGGAKMILDGKEVGKSWWDLAEDARKGQHQQNPWMMVLLECDDFTLYRITLKNSPMFHVSYNGGNGFTVWGLKIDTPATARNTDGVDPGSGSKNITVTQSYIRTGDDNIAIKGGGKAPTTNMTVIHNHFYAGHGMSIGSETQAGVSALRVTDLSLDGTDAGVRIKSQQAYGGLVHDAVYEDLCIRNSKAPIQLDTNYSANPKPGVGLIPVFTDITLRNVRISGGGKIQLNGFDTTHRVGITFDGVMLMDAASAYKFVVNHADVTLGPGPVNFKMPGTDSTARGEPGKGTLGSCEAKFVPFPAQ